MVLIRAIVVSGGTGKIMETARAPSVSLRIVSLTALAMVAFAANSVLNRLALAPELLDAASFSTIRVGSGALTLWLILAIRGGSGETRVIDLRMPVALFIYIAGFSFAYLSLGAGTGALILFGTVQLTMFAVALYQGERFPILGWAGLAAALGGLAYLVSPGVEAPDLFGAVLMIGAGIGWGVYSLLGRGARDPLAATAWNFLLCCPLVLIVSLLFLSEMSGTWAGVALAVASGAIASGLGYVIWYAVLPSLTAGRAASVQLSVPAIAALGGVVFLSEPLSLRLIIASVITLGGVALVLGQRTKTKVTQ